MKIECQMPHQWPAQTLTPESLELAFGNPLARECLPPILPLYPLSQIPFLVFIVPLSP